MMLAYRLGVVVVLFLGSAVSVSTARTRNPAVSWEDLPLIRSGVKVRAYSSYNPTGRTYRDFMNYTRRDGDEYELALHRGCGMLVQLWSTSIGDLFGTGQFGNVRMYLSDAAEADTDLAWDAQYTQSEFPHIQPLWNKAYAARWGFPCLAFDERFKATSTDMPHWYQFTCHLYREPRFSEAMDSDQIVAWNEKIARDPGTFPGKDRGGQNEKRSVSLPSAGRTTLFARTGPGVVRSLRLKVSDMSSGVLDRVWVRIQVDTLNEPAVYVPLSIFFGGYVNSPIDRAKGLPCGYDGRQLYFFLPMPFWQSMRVELENKSGQELTVDSGIGWSATNPYPRDAAGIFRMQYNDGVTVEKGQPDFPHLQIRGSGHIVGASANLAGSIEGNFRTYIDGSRTPAIETTGGEDYFCHAFGIKVGLLTPFHGGLNDKIGYRFHLCDYVPFLSEVYFGQDHAHSFTHDRDGTFRSAVFYYWNPSPALTLTDELDVGNRQSEKEHAYEIAGRRARVQTDEAGYEGNFDEIIRDSGRWTDGTTTFTVRIDSDNDGVRLRGRVNQLSYHQAVRVCVDGRPVGVWFEQGSQYHLFEEKPGSRDYQPHLYQPDWNHIAKRFRDTEFEIPASFTRGKSSIALAMKTLGAEAALDQADQGLTNEYYYWVYSYRKMDAGTETARLPGEVPVVDGPWWQIATEDYDAGRYSNKPAPGVPVEEGHQEVSDFTIYRAADGTWQLVSAVRQTRFPGEAHLLFRWEARNMTDEKWQEKGIFWTTATTPQAGYTDGVIYAPHCFAHDRTYYMFHNSGGTALVLTSRDGKRFMQATDHKGEYVFFPTGEAGRDLMVLDNRARDGLWHCFYTSIDRARPHLAGRQFSDVFVRTAENLTGPWSPPVAVGLGTPNRPEHIVHSKYDFVNTESQFVIYRKGFYYKFEQMYVVASEDVHDFEGKPVVSNLFPDFHYPQDWWPALGPEVVVDGDQYYIAAFRNHGTRPLEQGGVFVARLKWAPRATRSSPLSGTVSASATAPPERSY